MADRLAPAGHEQRIILAKGRQNHGANLKLFLEAMPHLRTEWNIAALMELGFMDKERLLGEIKIANPKTSNLAMPQAQAVEQNNHRVAGFGLKGEATRFGQLLGRGEYGGNLVLHVNERLERTARQPGAGDNGRHRIDSQQTETAKMIEKPVDQPPVAHSL